MHYFFVDYENTDPRDFQRYLDNNDDSFMVYVFIGACQVNVSVELATSIQRLGCKAEYIHMRASPGKNSLDFLIAFYLGKILKDEKDIKCTIISGDKGYDPLINHINLTHDNVSLNRIHKADGRYVKLGENFLDWIAKGVSNGEILINCKSSPLHVVPEGLLLVSPVIFKKYCREFNVSLTRLQRKFQKLKVNKKNVNGKNIWSYVVEGYHAQKRINGFLVSDPDKVFGIDFPGLNEGVHNSVSS